MVLSPRWYMEEQYSALVDSGDIVCEKANDCKKILQQQYNDVNKLSSEGLSLYNRWKYEEAIEKLKEAMKIIWDKTDENYKVFE